MQRALLAAAAAELSCYDSILYVFFFVLLLNTHFSITQSKKQSAWSHTLATKSTTITTQRKTKISSHLFVFFFRWCGSACHDEFQTKQNKKWEENIYTVKILIDWFDFRQCQLFTFLCSNATISTRSTLCYHFMFELLRQNQNKREREREKFISIWPISLCMCVCVFTSLMAYLRFPLFCV